MIEDYKIEMLQMMENAGRCLAHLARARFFGGNVSGKKVTVMVGTSGNGGGAMSLCTTVVQRRCQGDRMHY